MDTSDEGTHLTPVSSEISEGTLLLVFRLTLPERKGNGGSRPRSGPKRKATAVPHEVDGGS